jgi:antitoxin VapB
MPTAKVFMSGNSQAVRLPKEFRFAGPEVEIQRRGTEVVLTERPRRMKEVAALLRQLPSAAIDEVERLRDKRPPQKRRRP